MTKEWWVLVAFLAICFGCEALGSYFTELGIHEWYQLINKPSFTPPDWFFGPVWTYLYASLGTAAWFVWRSAEKLLNAPVAFFFFFLLLALTTTWPLFFFTWKDPTLALYNLIIIDAVALITTYLFWNINKASGWLMLPFLAWVSYATVLNAYIALHN